MDELLSETFTLSLSELSRDSSIVGGYANFDAVISARSDDSDDLTRVRVSTSLRVDQWEAAGRPTKVDVALYASLPQPLGRG